MNNFNEEYLKLLYQQYDEDYEQGGWAVTLNNRQLIFQIKYKI